MTTTASPSYARMSHVDDARPAGRFRRMPARRLVVIARWRDRFGMLGRVRLGKPVVGFTGESEKLAQHSLTRPAVSGQAGSPERLQSLQLVICGAPSQPALEVPSHKRDGHENCFDLAESVESVEVLQVSVVLDREQAHLPAAHVIRSDPRRYVTPVRGESRGISADEVHVRKSRRGGGRKLDGRGRRMTGMRPVSPVGAEPRRLIELTATRVPVAVDYITGMQDLTVEQHGRDLFRDWGLSH